MAKMKYWNGTAWEILDAKDADTVDSKHASATLNTTEKNDLAGAINEVKSALDEHKSDNTLPIKDTRDVATTPNDYNSNVVFQLKSASTIGLPAGNFGTLVGLRGWRDATADGTHELAFAGDGKIYYRQGRDTWEAWKRILNQDDYDQLFQYANDGKTDIAGAIGLPLSGSNTHLEIAQYINSQKATLATHLINKGIPANGEGYLKDLIWQVSQISTGKKIAEGEVTVTLSNNETYTVSGLDFVPKIVLSSALSMEGNYWYTLSAKMKEPYSEMYTWRSFASDSSYWGMYVQQEPTSNQIIFRCSISSVYILKKFWYLAIEG